MKNFIPDRPPAWTKLNPLADRPTAELRSAVETLWQKTIDLREEIERIKAVYDKRTVAPVDTAVVSSSSPSSGISAAQKKKMAANDYWIVPVDSFLDNNNVVFIYT